MTNQKSAPLSRAHIVSDIAAGAGLTPEQASAAAREFEAAITRAVSSGQEVRLNGFGSFKVVERAARMGRNPATGQTQEFPAKRVTTFAPALQLRDAVAGKSNAPAEANGSAPAAEDAKSEAPAKKPRKLGQPCGSRGRG